MVADSRTLTGVLCVAASALGFGAMAILARIAYDDGVDVPTVLALRFGIAALVMLPIAARERPHAFSRRTLLTLVLLGAVGYAGQAFAFFAALMYAPAGIVALLLYVYPALVALLSAGLLREHLDAGKLAALSLALGGMVLTAWPSLASETTSSAQPLGIALGFAAAAIYACYIIVSTPIARAASAMGMSTIVVTSAAVVFVIAVAVHGARWPASSTGWLAIVGIALICTVAAITLFFAGLARVGPTRAATLSTIEPAFTVVLASLVLGEHMGAHQITGGVLILLAVVMLARRPLRVPASVMRAS